MASVLRLGGIDQLLTELEGLAPALAAAAASVQGTIAEETASAIRAGYPSVTGTLRASVRVERAPSTSPVRVFARLVVGAPYAEYVEFGTSRQAPAAVFVPAARRGREAFVKAVIEQVRDAGLRVTGEAT
jgi:hypothetical protein